MMAEPLYSRDFTAFDNKTREAKLREIADREEIRELAARYAHRIARSQPVHELFTDDAVFVDRIPGRPVREFRSIETLRAMYAAVPANAPPLPMIHNHLIDIDGDEATGLCSIELRMAEGDQSMISSGYYDDIYRRVNGRWKFAMRDVTFFHWVPIQQGWAS